MNSFFHIILDLVWRILNSKEFQHSKEGQRLEQEATLFSENKYEINTASRLYSK